MVRMTKIPVEKRQEPENKECANCGGNHHANYRGCEYYKKEKEIVKTMVELEIPRHQAKKHIREVNQWVQRGITDTRNTYLSLPEEDISGSTPIRQEGNKP